MGCQAGLFAVLQGFKGRKVAIKSDWDHKKSGVILCKKREFGKRQI